MQKLNAMLNVSINPTDLHHLIVPKMLHGNVPQPGVEENFLQTWS